MFSPILDFVLLLVVGIVFLVKYIKNKTKHTQYTDSEKKTGHGGNAIGVVICALGVIVATVGGIVWVMARQKLSDSNWTWIVREDELSKMRFQSNVGSVLAILGIVILFVGLFVLLLKSIHSREGGQPQKNARVLEVHCSCCGNPLAKGNKFCTHCGKPVHCCSCCGEPLPSTVAKYCPNCGMKTEFESSDIRNN